MTITLYGEFTDLNKYINAERSNRFMGAKIKKENNDNAMKQMTLRDRIDDADYPVDITMTWYTKNLRVDPDNIAFAKKFLNDAMVTKGILRGDTRKDINSFRDLYGIDAKSPHVTIDIQSSRNPL